MPKESINDYDACYVPGRCPPVPFEAEPSVNDVVEQVRHYIGDEPMRRLTEWLARNHGVAKNSE